MKTGATPIVHGFASLPCLILSLFLPSLMLAQFDRSTPPAPAPPPEVNLAEYGSFELSNGMRVIVVENQKLPLVSVQVRFDIPPVVQGDKAGYVDLFGEMLAAGTGLRTKNQIDEQIDQVGAQFFTNSDGAYASGLKRHLPTILDIVSDVMTNATFPEKELERVRTRYISSVKQRKDDADAIAEAVGRSVTFGRTHPYGEVPTERTLANVSASDLKAYYKRFFRPEKGYLVFVGDITLKEAKDLAKKHFNKWKVPMEATVNEDGTETIEGLGTIHFLDRPLGPSGQRRVALVDRPGAAQSVIRVSFPLNLHPKDIRSMSAQVMNTILGGGVFNARLMQNLRETRAFTYGAYSSLEIDRFNGSFTATVSVRTEVTDSAITEIINELDRMRNTQVTANEIELAKSYMAGSFARSLEDPRTVARFALTTFLNGLPEDHYATYLKRLEAVTAADVETAAKEFLHPDNAIIFVVGDKDKIQHKLPALAADPSVPILELDENGEMVREDLEPAPGVTADQVIGSYLKAIGGRDKVAAIKDMYISLATDVEGTLLTIQQWHVPSGQYRSEVTSVAEDKVLEEVVFDGERAMRRGPQGTEELFDPELHEVRTMAMPVPELDPSKIAERISLGGRTTIGDEPAYKVAMATPVGGAISDYYSIDSGLKLRRIEKKFLGGRPVTITTDYKNYRPFSGVLFPTVIEQGGGPMGQITMLVEVIEINKGMPPNFFTTGLPPVQDLEDE